MIDRPQGLLGILWDRFGEDAAAALAATAPALPLPAPPLPAELASSPIAVDIPACPNDSPTNDLQLPVVSPPPPTSAKRRSRKRQPELPTDMDRFLEARGL